jgi:hypothetical protein
MQISITLRITGEFLSPDEITNCLMVTPHIARLKGQVRVSSSGKEIVSKTGIWTWKSEDLTNALTINDHINRLKITFEGVYKLFSALPNAEIAWVDICIVKNDEEERDSTVDFLMDTKSIEILNDVGLPVEFTIYANSTH